MLPFLSYQSRLSSPASDPTWLLRPRPIDFTTGHEDCGSSFKHQGVLDFWLIRRCPGCCKCSSWPPQEKLFIWSLFFQYNRRIQLAPHARRRAVPKTVSGWIPVVRLTSDEVAKSGRTGIMTAYTENMLSRKRTLWTA